MSTCCLWRFSESMSQTFAWILVHVHAAGCDWHMLTVGNCIGYIGYILRLSKTRKKILQHLI